MPKQMKRMSTIIALIKQELDGLAVIVDIRFICFGISQTV